MLAIADFMKRSAQTGRDMVATDWFYSVRIRKSSGANGSFPDLNLPLARSCHDCVRVCLSLPL